ncbi:MAG: hypothetical protein ACRDKT_12385 [Actinomycetota bacterium]
MGAVAAVTRPIEEFEEAMRLVRWGMNDCQISRLTGVPRGTIKDWRHRSLRQSDRAPRGPCRLTRAWDCPICGRGEIVDEARYAYLLGMYLGDGCISFMPSGVFRLRITLDEKYPLIIAECADAITAVRPETEMKVAFVQRTGCIEVSAYWKHWPCVFPQYGKGPKHLRKIALAGWQLSLVERHPRPLIRGLIQSDGSRFMNPVKRQWKADGPTRLYAYPRYMFTNASDDIRRIFCDACDAVGIDWRQSNSRTISIARRESVARMDEFVGPKC